MSRSFVSAGRRLKFTPAVAHKAGELVYHQGFYGIVQDDVAAAGLGTLILDAGVQILKNVYGSNLNPGVKVWAWATVIASTLQVFPAGSVPTTVNMAAIGRVWATSPASSATATVKVAFFHPNEY
jgi:predicted RecA/RadA family phage recombinase